MGTSSSASDAAAARRSRQRPKLLRAIRQQGHRYHRIRAVTMSLTLAILFVVPLAGIARFDLWGGDHLVLGESVSTMRGLVILVVAIAIFYAATFFVNMLAGRLFCGFGCPVGELSRLGDSVDAAKGRPEELRRAWAVLVGFATLFSTATLLWWSSPRILTEGGLRGVLTALGALAGVTGLAVFHARRWRWGFCRKACPIGLYYSAVQAKPLLGIEFDEAHGICIDCGACLTVCPVQIDPRHLEDIIDGPGGLSFDHLPAGNHCLHCGECVEICEHVTRKQEGPAAMAFRKPRPHVEAESPSGSPEAPPSPPGGPAAARGPDPGAASPEAREPEDDGSVAA